MRPPHPTPSPLSPPASRPAVRLAHLAAAAALLAAGCAHRGEIAPAPPARVRIQNHSDFAWRVTLAPDGGSAPTTWEIPPRGERRVAVPAGAYRLRQTPADAADAGARETAPGDAVRLGPGKSYTWPLATLLSAPEEPAP